jgi:hypothetical protein
VRSERGINNNNNNNNNNNIIQWVPGVLFPGLKQPACEADHSPPSSAGVKNEWSYISTPPVGLHGVVLNFIFTCTSY